MNYGYCAHDAPGTGALNENEDDYSRLDVTNNELTTVIGSQQRRDDDCSQCSGLDCCNGDCDLVPAVCTTGFRYLDSSGATL